MRFMATSQLPPGWRIELLDKVTVRGSGHTPSKDFPEYWNGGIKWISLSDSSALDQGYISKTDKEISAEGIKNSSAVLHPAETVVLSRDAGVGKSAVISEPMAVSQHFIAWRCDNSEKMNSWFLYNWLQMLKPEFERQAVGSTIKTIGLPYFKKLKIALPPYAEQEKIAQILSTWGQAVATTERLLDLARRQKKALMQQLLTGKKRFPMFKDAWKVVKLGSCFSRVTTRNDGQSENVVTISSQQGLIRQNEYFNRNVASETLDNYFLLKRGQFAYNKSYSIGSPMGAIKRLNRYDDGVVTTLYICFALAAEDRADSDFFEHYFESGLLNPGLTQIAHEGGRAHGLLNVKTSDFFDLQVPLPSLAEQVRIAETLTAADNKIEILQYQLDGLKQEKKALMQTLLTGKRRVSVDE